VAVTLLWARIFPELRRARTFDVPPQPPPEKAPITAGSA
jgi:hypothetical protein